MTLNVDSELFILYMAGHLDVSWGSLNQTIMSGEAVLREVRALTVTAEVG